jgi:hypothetical protein
MLAAASPPLDLRLQLLAFSIAARRIDLTEFRCLLSAAPCQ